MVIKLIDASEMSVAKGKHVAKREHVAKAERVTNGESITKIERVTKEKEETKEYKRPEIVAPVACVTKKSMTILSEGKILKCERLELGASDNCALCQGVDNKIFIKCKNKWVNY